MTQHSVGRIPENHSPGLPGARTRGRQYVRAFDYEEARRRHAQGESISLLAREYGVSSARVRQVVNPDVAARAAARASAYRWPCMDCGAPTRTKGRRCSSCSVRLRATSVRENELQCVTCRKWKPDDAFPLSRSEEVRRGRHSQCRPCQTESKRAYRERKREKQRAYDREYKRRRRELAERKGGHT